MFVLLIVLRIPTELFFCFEEISPRAIYDKEIKELIDQMESDLLFILKNTNL